MKVGLFFGSFNPIHIGHLIVARYWLNETDLDQLWLIVSPHNPHKAAQELAPAPHRLAMARLAIQEDEQIHVSDIEFHLPTPSYTIHTLDRLQEQYPTHTWVLLFGSDTANTLPTWRDGTTLLQKWPIWVYPRGEGILHINPLPSHLQYFHEAPRVDLSATQVRKYIHQRRSIRFLVPIPVELYIREHGLYHS
ncbi:MAG: nicotinate (nicotinamide) nucleotide adenylyltransferase [Bacteroidia bacterium]|nr:nicotinate (nicotinamide) nucleotide adenylyltransferase [Bacteroidia bacterium]